MLFFGGDNEGLTFTLHNTRSYDTLIGMHSGFLGYGWTDTNDWYLNERYAAIPQTILGSFAIEAIEVDINYWDAHDLLHYSHLSFLSSSILEFFQN